MSSGNGIPKTEGPMMVPDEDAIAPKPKGWQFLFPKLLLEFCPR